MAGKNGGLVLLLLGIGAYYMLKTPTRPPSIVSEAVISYAAPGVTALNGAIRLVTPIGAGQTITTVIPEAATKKAAVWREDTGTPVIDTTKQKGRPLVVGKILL